MRNIILLYCLLFFASAIAENCFEYDTDYLGTIVNDPLEQRTESAEECQILCHLGSCEGFTWASADFSRKDFLTHVHSKHSFQICY